MRSNGWASPIKKTPRYRDASPEQREKYLKQIARIPPPRRVYLDESGFHEYFYRRDGWALAGVPVLAQIYGRHFSSRNVVAGLRGLRLLAVEICTGVMDAVRFELWLAKKLLPRLRPGDVVMMDNARFHCPREICRLARRRGLRVIFLPPYSPDLNPIEHVWANKKQQLRSLMPQQNSPR